MLVEAVFTTGLHYVGAILLAAFTAARVLLWAVFVVTAWYEIIEKPFESELRRTKKPKNRELGPEELTQAALKQHQAAETVDNFENNKAPPARYSVRMPRIAADIDDVNDEDIEKWSIWGEENSHAHLSHEGIVAETATVPAVHTRGHNILPDTVPLEAGVRPAVTVVSLKEGKKRGDEKKPFVTRKLEQMFVSPYKEKYEHTAYFLYRGLNKAGIRLETSINSLTKELDGSIRDAGVEAVNRVEVVMRRYLNFFGAVVILTLILMPLPSVHISLGIA